MAIQSLNQNVATDTVQFTLPLLDQMRWRDNQYHLIVTDLTAQLLDHAGGNTNGSRPAHERLARTHAANEQNAVS